MRKSTINGPIFNSYVSLPEGKTHENSIQSENSAIILITSNICQSCHTTLESGNNPLQFASKHSHQKFYAPIAPHLPMFSPQTHQKYPKIQKMGWLVVYFGLFQLFKFVYVGKTTIS